MHGFTTLLTFVAFGLASVSAAPLHQRRTCRAHSRVSQVAAVSTTAIASSSTVQATSIAAIATSVEVASSSKPSSTKVATTIEAAAEPTSTHAVSSEASSTKVSSTKASSTKASSTKAAAATSSASSSNSGTSSLLKKLFPVTHSAFWTTSSESSDALPLDDSTLGVTKLLKSLSHDYVKAPDGKYSMKATYPKGSYTFTHKPLGGLSFYATGPSSVDLDNAKEATLAYSVYFEEGFDFQKGGKLPGFYGGDDAETAVSCSGGRRDDGCWSTRFMWRTGGEGEAYTYLPPDYEANKAVCNVAPFSTCNDVYGASVGRGAFSFAPGTRTTIAQRVRLNDVGKENGELEIFVEGKSLWTVKGLVFRGSEAGRIRGIQMQTFFGGSNPSWASPKDQSTYFSDFSVAVTEKL
ncbi:hypothetical protein C8Q77DRAFT_1161834 [Trametes polyzona]|nr:hypothetical protein C8Q77DRAFT_1161834 [Trametes polyzona]